MFFPKSLLRKIKDIYFEIKGQKNEKHYLGDNVFCPCCGKRFSSFMDFQISKENNLECFLDHKESVCAYCLSYPRHRIICQYFENNKNIIPKNNILVFGAEISIKKWFNINGYKYRTADLFDRSSDIKVDIQNIPFPDDSWEVIICNHILEHVPDYKIALKELKRVLAKNGFLEITVPTDRTFTTVYENSNVVKKEDRIKYFGQYDHLRIFGNDFEKILRETGFIVEIIDGDTLPPEIVSKIGPAKYDDNRVYICRKHRIC